MLLVRKYLPVVSLVLYALWMTKAYLDKRDDLTKAIEQCNTEKLASIAEAERLVRESTQAGLEARIAQIEAVALDAQRARDIAIEARREAENRPERVRTVIQRVRDEDACIDTDLHPDLLVCLRNNEDCGETRSGAGANGL